MKGKVVKNIADKFEILQDSGERIAGCVARGNLKQKGKALVGDNVIFEMLESQQPVIIEIEKRKNSFIRPPIANIDIMLIVISEKPKPDFLLVDKLIINCEKNNVLPFIVINKEDVSSEKFISEVKETYVGSGVEILVVSAKNENGKEKLIAKIKNNLVCLAGQSAVGKSSLMNMILERSEKVGELSKKIERGKNTTRHAEIFYNEDKCILIADTAGFSKFDALDVKYNEIEHYYREFDKFRDGCMYKPCSHIFEKNEECAVKSALNDCKINKNRYNNYKQLYIQIKNTWENRYE